MIMNELIEKVAEVYKHPEEGDADRNGNTRLAVLQERFHLSSLKIQKILVTAGVYEPVKSNTAYEKITRLRKAGKSVEEIVKITGMSYAMVSACFPYERSIYNVDRSSMEVSGAAARKRKQRSREEMKRNDAIGILRNNMTDETFWDAVREHERESFISTDGERYSVSVRVTGSGKEGSDFGFREELCVHPGRGRILLFPKDDVLAVLHNALELKASGNRISISAFDQVSVLPYVYPLLVFFGVIPGERKHFSVRRVHSENTVCACCGRRAEYTVRTYKDLVEIAAEMEEEERSGWDLEEREKVERQEAALHRVGWEEIAKRDSASIRAFNAEGERFFCTLCAETIRMALEDGELPHSAAPVDFEGFSPEAAEAGVKRYFAAFPEGAVYEDRYGRKYPACLSDDHAADPFFFFREKDREGAVHFFACYAQRLPGYRIFEAMEIHRLTKAGKRSGSCTGTDYEFRTGLKAIDEEDLKEDRRRVHIGFLELMNRIRDALLNPALKWHEGPPWYSNAVTIRGKQCLLRSTGEMQVVYADGQNVQGRKWEGGPYGFMIDGIIFTGEETALMSGGHEGANLQYRFSDSCDPPLRAGEYLMPVQLGEKELAAEVSDLLNLFTEDGEFISDHDEENFGILFEKTVLKKLKLYHDSNPRGYGKLAGMQIIKRLRWVGGTDYYQDQVRNLIQL